MSYTNQWGRNPISLSNNIELRSGTSATAEAVTDEYIALGYEPGLGTTYYSTSGNIFVHTTAGTDANDWSKITDAVQPDSEVYNATLSLTPSITKVVSRIFGSSITLTPSIKKDIARILSGTITLTPSSVEILEKEPLSGGITLTPSFSYKRPALSRNETIALTPVINKSIVKSAFAGTITLGVSFDIIKTHSAGVTITLTPSITKTIIS